MITRFVEIDGDTHGYTGKRMERRSNYFGKSTDAKPVAGVKNADIFYEMDTGSVFLYDEDVGNWMKQ